MSPAPGGPTLDAIADDPGLAQDLALPTCLALQHRLVVVLAALSGRMTGLLAASPPTAPVRDRTLSVVEAAERLNLHPKTLARRARHAPFADMRVTLGVRRLG